MARIDLNTDDHSLWERFWAAPDSITGPLGRRWWRARAAGATPEGPREVPVHTEQRLALHRERSGAMLHLLDDVVAPSLGLFESNDFALLFADADGVVLARRAGGGFHEEADRVYRQAGTQWDESTRGTNAIGTALIEQRPVTVRGTAHLARPNHRLACYAAPVRDPWGEVVGVLDATSFLSRANPMTGAAVIATVKAMEEALRMSLLDGAGSTLIHRLMGRISDPALLVGPDGRIHAANQAAIARGLPLGPALGSADGVLRVRARLDSAVPLHRTDLEAIASGQLRVPGIDVEPVLSRDGRPISWLVVLTRTPPLARPEVAAAPHAFEALTGIDSAVVAVRHHAGQLARSTLPVLILGETGTGKELLARDLHRASLRSGQPFVAVNCATLSPELLRSELFGYVEGAFTGARRGGQQGRITLAHGGTLFLDELGEMPPPLQSLLLRFLEDGTFHRVGESTPSRADVRLVCATSRDLEQMVSDGRFRADLFYRIRGATLRLPPIRARSDRALLCRTLLAQLCQELNRPQVPTLSADALHHIDQAPWPGNVRELRMTLHHAIVAAGGAESIQAWHLPQTTRTHTQQAPSAPAIAPSPNSLKDAKVTALQQALAAARGNVSEAARSLGIARSTVYRLMRKHGLASG